MCRKLLFVCFLSAVTLFGSSVIAQNADEELEAGKHWLMLMNHKGDTDNTVSKHEFERYMRKQFEQADADHNGVLDARELGHLHNALLSK